MLWLWLVVAAPALRARALVLAPPWADVRRNPCAALPRGWQMLYWPPDGKCYPIFKRGAPCPETMELTPVARGGAQCRCPPGAAREADATRCHALHRRGPCPPRHYLAPVDTTFSRDGERTGVCVKVRACADDTQLFWPEDGRCYAKYSRGPCYVGTLLHLDEDGLANCSCPSGSRHYWVADGGCYERGTRGPCSPGLLFLAGGVCGCDAHLPHYHEPTDACYEIGTIGPCNKGHLFILNGVEVAEGMRATCHCKPFHELWSGDGACYRLYTRGPCDEEQMLAPGARCVPVPCARGRLYFPAQRRCFKLGTPGPCADAELVVYDFEARPSVDGISYNGICACKRALYELHGACPDAGAARAKCADRPGMVAVADACHMLYTQGPCDERRWLAPAAANGTDALLAAECQCRPPYAAQRTTAENGTLIVDCVPPTVQLAKYLNDQYFDDSVPNVSNLSATHK